MMASIRPTTLELSAKNALLGFLLSIPWLLYDGYNKENSMVLSMLIGIIFLLARLYLLHCFDSQFFFSYAYGISLVPALVLSLREVQPASYVTSLLLKQPPIDVHFSSLWQYNNMMIVIQIIVAWNSCFSYSFMTTHSSQGKDKNTVGSQYTTGRNIMFLIDAVFVTVSLCNNHKDGEVSMVLFYFCVVLSSFGIQYIQNYLKLRPFEICTLSSLYFGFLFIEFQSEFSIDQLQDIFDEGTVVIITTKMCTFLFTAAILLCGILFIMDLRMIRDNIMLLVFLVVFLVITLEFINAHMFEILPKNHMIYTRLFMFGSIGLGAYVSIILDKGIPVFCMIYFMMSLVCMHYYIYTNLKVEIIQWLISYCLNHDKNVFRLGFYVVALIILVPVIPFVVRRYELTTITSRKLFHLLSIVLFSYDIAMSHTIFLHIAMAGATVVFFIIEMFKVVVPLSNVQKTIMLYVAPYLDNRDKNRPIIVSHIYLLLGCALPVWLVNIAKLHSTNDTNNISMVEKAYNLLLPVGLVTVGVGDTVAAIVGSNYGRSKWISGSNRSYEGTLAGFAASVAVWYMFYNLYVDENEGNMIFQMGFKRGGLFIAISSSLLEAITDESDNLVVPIHTMVVLCAILTK